MFKEPESIPGLLKSLKILSLYSKRKVGIWDPMQKLVTTSPYLIVDSEGRFDTIVNNAKATALEQFFYILNYYYYNNVATDYHKVSKVSTPPYLSGSACSFVID
jgi:hypothetical protein